MSERNNEMEKVFENPTSFHGWILLSNQQCAFCQKFFFHVFFHFGYFHPQLLIGKMFSQKINFCPVVFKIFFKEQDYCLNLVC